ncbi:MAG: polysaccharide deacetylase [Clostridiales bacterium]|nr:polysaccharide deacetylase [Clostridiales bacterium]
MWNGKKKAVTFSFDDGVVQDIRTIEILNKYGLKATFNLNSGYFGCVGAEDNWGARHDKVLASRVKEIYQGHEIAVHTLTHPNLTTLDEETIIRQVELDRKALEELCGYEIIGMAYPCGGVNNDDRVAEIIRKNTPIRYSRTITSTHNFDLQENLLRFNPTVYYMEKEKTQTLIDEFLAKDTDEPQLFYFWGHTYEFDRTGNSWEEFENICKKLAGHADIFYGTNKEVLL